MPQNGKNFNDYLDLVDPRDLYKRPDRALFQDDGGCPKFFARKKCADGVEPKQKNRAIWHVKDTRRPIPLDGLGYFTYKLLYPTVCQAIGFKIRIWRNERDKQWLVASKHLEGFIPWSKIEENITIVGGGLTYGNVPIKGYGTLHPIAFLNQNSDLHDENFGIVPVYNAAKQIIYYQVIIIDFDQAFCQFDANEPVVKKNLRTKTLPIQSKKAITYKNKDFDSLPQVVEERRECLFSWLALDFTKAEGLEIAEPLAIGYSDALMLLEERRKATLKLCVSDKDFVSFCDKKLKDALDNSNKILINAIIQHSSFLFNPSFDLVSDTTLTRLIPQCNDVEQVSKLIQSRPTLIEEIPELTRITVLLHLYGNGNSITTYLKSINSYQNCITLLRKLYEQSPTPLNPNLVQLIRLQARQCPDRTLRFAFVPIEKRKDPLSNYTEDPATFDEQFNEDDKDCSERAKRLRTC